MINRKRITSSILITAVALSLAGCGEKEMPVSAEAAQTAEESTEESTEESVGSTEPAPSPTVAPTEEPAEESSDSEEISGVEENVESSESESGATEEEENALGYEITPVDDKVLYALQSCNLRSGPGTDYEKVGSLSYAQKITVNGKVEQGSKLWWVLKTEDGSIQMVSGGLVSEVKPSTGNNGSGGGSSGNNGNNNGNGGQPQQSGDSQPSDGNGGQPQTPPQTQQPPVDDGGGIGDGFNWDELEDVGGIEDWGGGSWFAD